MIDDSLLINTSALKNIVYVTATSSKWRQPFLKNGYPFDAKKLKILYISYHTVLFKFHQHVVQILIKLYTERLSTFISVSNGSIKCPIGKWIFAVNLELEFFSATVANADIGRLECLQNIIWYVFEPHAGKIWTTYGPKCTKLWYFWQKLESFKTIFDKP